MKPYMTSNDLIASVKRKISFPASQATFTNTEILAFANEEMAISQVPSILMYHEEYFVYEKDLPLVADKSRYPIPSRATGGKLRDLYYKDTNGNKIKLTRISPEDQALFDKAYTNSNQLAKYYLQNNDVILLPNISGNPTGSLLFQYYLRPNQLVKDNRAAIITNFVETITVNLAGIAGGDTVTIDGEVFTAVIGAPAANEFQIGLNSVTTATNLVQAINTNGVVSANNGSPSTSIIKLQYSDRNLVVTTDNSSGFIIPDTIGLEFNQLPSDYTDDETGENSALFTEGSFIDILQTNPGHKLYNYDVEIQSISGLVAEFIDSDIPTDVIVGDYISLSHECIIPQIPPDLHNELAERAGARILAALGDQSGLAVSLAKVGEMTQMNKQLLDNRVDGAPLKVFARNSLIRHLKRGSYRR